MTKFPDMSQVAEIPWKSPNLENILFSLIFPWQMATLIIFHLHLFYLY